MSDNLAKYLVENWKEFMWPAVLFAAVIAAGWVVRRVLFTRLRRWAASARTPIYNILIDSLHGTFLLWILILAIHLATEYSNLPRGVTATKPGNSR